MQASNVCSKARNYNMMMFRRDSNARAVPSPSQIVMARAHRVVDKLPCQDT